MSVTFGICVIATEHVKDFLRLDPTYPFGICVIATEHVKDFYV